MKAIWNGAIGFGLVNIPVKIYSATETTKLDLDMLDKSDFSNIRFKRVNENTGKEVKWENIVKGFLMDDKYIVLDEEDYAAASPEKTKILSIDQFVKESEVDSVYFETPYYLEPQKNGENAYRLLLKALEETQMVGIGTFVLRETETIGMIRPYKDNILVLNRLRFDQEIRDYTDLKLPAQKAPKPAELKMAVSLIKQLSQEFDPALYKDTYSDELMKIIKQKAKGKNVKAKKAEPAKEGKVIDLMAQLKASLSSSKSKSAS
ncbi:Ku protein [Chryseobacterium indologenes]|uniref:Non-homologous end joining protein Ku n=1 Tax=Chryseobacterium indologenes TaxID=253 RepID=A0A4U8VLC4_CHRID|nr:MULTISPECIES: Ku protein [Chryseobacterium]ASE62857.1 Ku protein [Chryseobacterium indologenes]AZB18560.1 Ku protein [Chryseobacterium indologenes]QPQ52788.1 Ku protein [Chryseobacterium indologenes]TLX25756.1 Ku protein [Chryseobacterium indologenes]SFK16078.1 DNA end-binding protein Ku [Chryseobacterium indologenes]